MSEQYYGVYRVLKGGKYRYVSRSATANKRLAEQIADDFSRGEIVTPTGAIKHVKAYPHVARPIETAKKNPRTVESGELAIYAINNADLYRQRTQPILKNLKLKIAKGKYDAALALKLWKYAADDAAQRYAKEFGGVWHKLFSVADRKEAAKEIADHYAEELRENPRRKVTRVQRNPTARIRRPSQTRRRSGFPGYIVTFIRTNAFRHKRQYIGGSKGRWTVVYKRNLAQVFSTSDKAKNVVRNNRKWFELNSIKQVTILRTNEHIGKFD